MAPGEPSDPDVAALHQMWVAPSHRGFNAAPCQPHRFSTLVLRVMEHTAQALKIQLQSAEVLDPADLENAVSALVKGHVGAIAVQDDPMLIAQAGRIADLARRHQLPMIGFVEYARAGGLLAFGVNLPDLWRRAAGVVDKILKGAKPADLPVEQPTRFDLVINLKTAKTLGLTIPQSLLLRADQVMQ
jgi:putative ABC transport system substrate-binding protein